MTVALMQSVYDHLGDTLLAGLQRKYFRWTDADEQGTANFVVLRNNGAGIRDASVQRPDLKMMLVFKPTDAVIGNQKSEAIFQKLADGTKPNTMLKIEPMGAVTGPYYLENGRCVYEINMRCYVAVN